MYIWDFILAALERLGEFLGGKWQNQSSISDVNQRPVSGVYRRRQTSAVEVRDKAIRKEFEGVAI